MQLINATLASIPQSAPAGIAEAVRERWNSLTKPRGSLGRLEQSVLRLAEIQGNAMPVMDRRAMYVFCGDHGITAEGVSLYPSVVTREMVKNFLAGGAAINVLCRQFNIEPLIVDTGVLGQNIAGTLDRRAGEGTRNFLNEAAMSKAQAVQAIENGIRLAQDAAVRFNIAGVGEMGIGNSTSASALLCAFTGISVEQAVGSGTGLDAAGLQHKQAVLTAALARVDLKRIGDDPLAIAAEFGGFEILTMAGFFLGAAGKHLPVVVDGFISASAFLIAQALCPRIGNYLLFAHRSAEKGHAALLSLLSVTPLLDLEMRLGEGTGAALAIGLLASALALYREMATFAQASVSDTKKEEQHS
jgi:nicotinate-nucleotide--dimethylbenzimidazole phosphoribosyltransferase